MSKNNSQISNICLPDPLSILLHLTLFFTTLLASLGPWVSGQDWFLAGFGHGNTSKGRSRKQGWVWGCYSLAASCLSRVTAPISLPSLRALFLQVLVRSLASHHFCPRGGEVFCSRYYSLQGTAPYPLVSLNHTQFLQTALY